MAVVVVSLAFRYLGLNLVQGFQQIDLDAVRSQWPVVLLAGALLQLCILLGVWTYHLILRGIGWGLDFRRSARIQLFASMGQFLPG